MDIFVILKGIWRLKFYLLNPLEDFFVYDIVSCRWVLTIFSFDQNLYAATVCDPG